MLVIDVPDLWLSRCSSRRGICMISVPRLWLMLVPCPVVDIRFWLAADMCAPGLSWCSRDVHFKDTVDVYSPAISVVHSKLKFYRQLRTKLRWMLQYIPRCTVSTHSKFWHVHPGCTTYAYVLVCFGWTRMGIDWKSLWLKLSDSYSACICIFCY